MATLYCRCHQHDHDHDHHHHHHHNKFIFFAVQRLLCKTKRLYFDEGNKPYNEVQAVKVFGMTAFFKKNYGNIFWHKLCNRGLHYFSREIRCVTGYYPSQKKFASRGFVWVFSLFCIFMIHPPLCILVIYSPLFKSKFNFSFLTYLFLNTRLILRYIKTQSQHWNNTSVLLTMQFSCNMSWATTLTLICLWYSHMIFIS